MDSLSEQFSGIYDEYIGKIYRFVFLKVNSEESAQDITSKVFLKGWESFARSGGKIENPGAFLYQIARNKVVDFYREKGRSNVIPADSAGQLADTGENAHETAVFNDDMKAVMAGIGKLKKEYQDVVLWHYVEDMPVPEIAKLMGKNEGNVRVMLHRGLKDLKDFVIKS